MYWDWSWRLLLLYLHADRPTGQPTCSGKSRVLHVNSEPCFAFTAPVLPAVVLDHCGGFQQQAWNRRRSRFNPKPPSPHPGETGVMKHAHSPAYCKPMSALHELKEHLSLSAKSFRQAGAGQGRASSRVLCTLAVSCSIGTALLHLSVGWTPQRWVWHSPTCSECGAGAQYWKHAGRCCTKATLTAFLAVFTTALGCLLPPRIWADLQWQKPC